MIKKTIGYLFGCLFSLQSHAAIKTELIQYSDNDAKMEGYVAYDDASDKPKPGILIVHDWMGLGKFTKEKAEKLAKEGYVAFAVDVYGKGNLPEDQEDAAHFANQYKNNRALLQSHMKAAYNALINMKQVDKKQIIVMGYCFGGTAALELARTGVPLIGTATFHGGLSNPTPNNAKNIKGKVLVMHGADDPNVPPKEVEDFKKEMKDAKIDMKFIAYPGAVHAFTNPQVGNDKSKGVAFNAEADQKSWSDFEAFLANIVGQ